VRRQAPWRPELPFDVDVASTARLPGSTKVANLIDFEVFIG
jgi:hypothetical protein